MAEAASCLICDADTKLLGRRGEWHYATCGNCKAVQLLDPPGEEELNRLYQDYHHGGHYFEDPAKLAAQRKRVCDQLADLATEGTTPGDEAVIVELGSGWGGLGKALRERGCNYIGFEPNQTMAEYARRQGLDIRAGAIREMLADADLKGKVATLVLMAVFEHLPEPTHYLREMGHMLAPGGRLILQCPTAGIPRFVGRILNTLTPRRELPGVFGSLAPPWHLWLPSPQSVRLQAPQCGLDIAGILVSRSGRGKGIQSFLQFLNEAIGTLGFTLFGERWPFAMAHVFILNKPKDA